MQSKTKSATLLVAGVLLVVLANVRWPIALLAWLAPVPWLAYLRGGEGWRRRLTLAGTVVLAWMLTVLKISTGPFAWPMALMLGGVIGVFQALPYLGWDLVRRRAAAGLALLAFPALCVIAEWLQAHVTPLGSWGAVAYTQLDDLPLVQMASLFGLAGLAFLVNGFAAAVEHGLASRGAGRWRPLAIAGAAVFAAHLFGVVRLATSEGKGGATRLAAVGTDATFGGPPLPGRDELERINQALFARTRAAAQAGARLVAWNEAATLIWPDQEPAFLARAADVARQEGIELVVAFVEPAGVTPFPYHNQYVWIRPDGSLAGVYHKRRPVPGEAAIAGRTPAAIVATGFGAASGVICYDADYPDIARAAARAGAGLLVVPSSDWRGIDPMHTAMASLRAIEGGMSLLRSTRFGLSAGIDPYGRVRGAVSSFDSPAPTLIVSLPTSQVFTLYRHLGDLPVAACTLLVLAALRPRRRGAL